MFCGDVFGCVVFFLFLEGCDGFLYFFKYDFYLMIF